MDTHSYATDTLVKLATQAQHPSEVRLAAALALFEQPSRVEAQGESSAAPPLDIVFDGPPGPEGPRFVEAERRGKSVVAGEWLERDDGRWVLRIDAAAPRRAESSTAQQALESLAEDVARFIRTLRRDGGDVDVHSVASDLEMFLRRVDIAVKAED